eukprot:TRINITY_DN6159_c0_g1_i10.p1 TRINITY_DN6159_c0_g1~~TRINITY_DN6159_c0_g1_i10.p1  ORF type:complete len:527 (+),score=63.65 TRINITY_DN6159_c0_g1_i10:340-1920(+)
MAAPPWPPKVGCTVLVQQWEDNCCDYNSGKIGQWQKAVVTECNGLGKAQSVQYEELLEDEESDKLCIEEVQVAKMKPWCCAMQVDTLEELKIGDPVLWHDQTATGWWSGYVCDKDAEVVRLFFPDYPGFEDVRAKDCSSLCFDYDFFFIKRIPRKKPPNNDIQRQYISYLQKVYGDCYTDVVLTKKAVVKRGRKRSSQKSETVNYPTRSPHKDKRFGLSEMDIEVFEACVRSYGPLPLIECRSFLSHVTSQQILDLWNKKKDEYLELVRFEQKKDYARRSKRTVDVEAVNQFLDTYGYNRPLLLKQFQEVRYQNLFTVVEDQMSDRSTEDNAVEMFGQQGLNRESPASVAMDLQMNTPVRGTSNNAYYNYLRGQYMPPKKSPYPQVSKQVSIAPPRASSKELQLSPGTGTEGEDHTQIAVRCSPRQQNLKRKISDDILVNMQKHDVQKDPIAEDLQFSLRNGQSFGDQFGTDIEEVYQLIKRARESKDDQQILGKMEQFAGTLRAVKHKLQTFYEAQDVQKKLQYS